MNYTFSKINRVRTTYNIHTIFGLNRMHRIDAIVFTNIRNYAHTHIHSYMHTSPEKYEK